MNVKKPELQDFGITPDEYHKYVHRGAKLDAKGVALGIVMHSLAVAFIFFSIVLLFLVEAGIVKAIVIAALIMIFPPGVFVVAFVIYFVHNANLDFMDHRLSKTPVGSASKLYEKALAAYNRALLEAEREAQQEAERAEEKRLAAEQARERDRLEAEQAQERARLEAKRAQERARREAEQARRRKLVEHWMSLSGPQFEQELATVYRDLGYSVKSTAGSGDGGVDLILRKDGKTIVVQCKSHQAPVGPAIARELFGAMVASRADSAILACTGGFTRGVRKFVQGKPIILISASDLAALGGAVEDNPQDEANRGLYTKLPQSNSVSFVGSRLYSEIPSDGEVTPTRQLPFHHVGNKGYKSQANSPPICPKPGCGKEMVPRAGRHGRFWGCPRFPQCRGYRPIQHTEG